MATLEGRTIASSYTELLKTTSSSGVTSSLDTVQDGNATDSALQISEAAVKSTGTLTSTGNFDVATDKLTVNATSGNTAVAGTLDVTGQITGNVTGNVTGDVKATDGTSVLDSGTDGTDATFTGTATKADQLSTARNIELTGDVTGNVNFNGTADVDISSTLSNTAVTAGTYGSATASPRFTVDSKGRITGVSEVTITGGGGGGGGGSDATSIQGVAVSSTDPTTDGEALVYTGSEYEAVAVVKDANAVSTNTASKVVKRDSSGNFAAGTITAALTGNASTATAWATGRDVALTGDVTGTATGVDGSGNVSISSTLANSGVTAATYGDGNTVAQVVVDAKGRITTATDVDISIPASQISDAGTAATLNAADANWNANKIQGRDVASTAPDDGQTLSWNNSASQWEPTTGSATNANQLQGRDIQNVAPNDGESLIWDNGNSRWSPAAINIVTDTTPQLGGDLDVNGQDIVSTSNANIEIAPNGTGATVFKGNTNAGAIKLNCESNSHGQTIIAQPHSAGVTNTLTLPAGSDQEIVGTTATQTLSNKTITGLVIGTDVQAYDADTTKNNLSNSWSAAQQGNTQTAAFSALTVGSDTGVLDFDTYQNFVITLSSGTNTFTNPTADAGNTGQTGTIVLIQPSSGAAGTMTVTASGDYKPVGGAVPSLSSTNSAVDIIPYMIQADNTILLGAPQLDLKATS